MQYIQSLSYENTQQQQITHNHIQTSSQIQENKIPEDTQLLTVPQCFPHPQIFKPALQINSVCSTCQTNISSG